MFFESWNGIIRVLVVGGAAYLALVLMLRISGQRTLTKLNAFDLVVTVALGSVLATVMLSKSVPLAEGILALAVLIFLQFAITWLSVRSSAVSRMIKSEPALVFSDGVFLEKAMKRERLTKDEVRAAIRSSGTAKPDAISAVILETDGSLSVVKRPEQPNLAGVPRTEGL
ncbi:DUF421 domain-containing protein [Martelella mediterranea]|uniref:DUF421 domain-containing protein n=1 Tax=Martelella mediterranea TaxID=293089 RepID=UPI001E2A578C|nr:YetF domain-containing protein [Martelella mediterranea]MCD1633826.1 DUF421 domain-containing protein [Martelella mediterranea]